MSSTKFDLFPTFLFYFFKIFGVAPISFCSEFTTPFMTSRIGLLYNLLLACPVIGLSYFSLKFAYLGNYGGRIAFEKIVDTVQTFFDIFAALFVLSVFCIFQKRVVEIANRLYAIYKLSICLTYKMGHDVNLGPSTLCTSVKRIIIINSVTAAMWFTTTILNVKLFLIYFLIMSLNNLIMLSILLQYSIILKLLHYLYHWVNENLISLLKIVNVSNLQMKTIRLSQLREIYVSLNHLSRDVSCFYSLPILICICDVFITLIIYGYYVLRSIVIWNSDVPGSVILHCVMMVVMSIVMITILARAAGLTVRESKTTGEIVSESIAACQNERVAKELKDFSIYLLHKNVDFSVYQFFSLNETLVISIISSITTYLVILIQFKESSRS